MPNEPSPSDADIPQITGSSTKQEMLAAYKEMVKRLKEKRETELKPQQRTEERQNQEAVQVADSLSTEGIAREVGNLRSEINRVLIGLSDRMEEEIGQYSRLKRAVEVREKELEDLSAIEREALSLAALLEAQKEKRERFDSEMAEKKQALEAEIASTRAAWKQEQKSHDEEVAAREAAEKKKREREAEEYSYTFERQKRLAKEQFEYEKARMERETQARREELERDLTAREQTLKAQETEIVQLREKAAASAAELAAAVDKAVKETTARLTREAEAREALLKKGFEGEEKVLRARIESLQETVKEQQQQIARLSAQTEKSYTQVQEIAVRAIEGSGGPRGGPVMPPVERPRGTGQLEG